MRRFGIFLIGILSTSVGFCIDKIQQQEELREAAQIRAAMAQVQAAAVGLNAAQQAFAAAKQKAEFARSGLQKMTRFSQQLHEMLETRYEEKVGVTAAREAVRLAQEEFDAVSQPILAALQESASYRAAVADANAARQRLKTLGPEVEAAEKQEISQVTLKPGQLERAAIDSDSRAKAAKEKVVQVGEALRAALAKLNQTVDQDSEYKKSLAVVAKSQSEYNSAKAVAAREERALGAAANKLAAERAQFVALQRAQAADDALDWKSQLQRNAKK